MSNARFPTKTAQTLETPDVFKTNFPLDSGVFFLATNGSWSQQAVPFSPKQLRWSLWSSPGVATVPEHSCWHILEFKNHTMFYHFCTLYIMINYTMCIMLYRILNYILILSYHIIFRQVYDVILYCIILCYLYMSFGMCSTSICIFMFISNNYHIILYYNIPYHIISYYNIILDHTLYYNSEYIIIHHVIWHYII